MPDHNKRTKNYYETDFKTLLLSDDPDYFRDSSQSQSQSQSSSESQ